MRISRGDSNALVRARSPPQAPRRPRSSLVLSPRRFSPSLPLLLLGKVLILLRRPTNTVDRFGRSSTNGNTSKYGGNATSAPTQGSGSSPLMLWIKVSRNALWRWNGVRENPPGYFCHHYHRHGRRFSPRALGWGEGQDVEGRGGRGGRGERGGL